MVDYDVRMTLRAACSGAMTRNSVLHVDGCMRIVVLEDGRIRIEVFDQNRAVYQNMYHYVQSVLVQKGRACDFRDGCPEPPWSFSFAPAPQA